MINYWLFVKEEIVKEYYLSIVRTLRRKSSTSSTSSSGSGRTPPQTPRLLPSAPPSPAMARSASIISANIRPRSGPAGLHSYTGSAPSSRYLNKIIIIY